MTQDASVKDDIPSAIDSAPFGTAAIVVAILGGIVMAVIDFSALYQLIVIYDWDYQRSQETALSKLWFSSYQLSAGLGWIIAIIGLITDRNRAFAFYALFLVGAIFVLGTGGFGFLILFLTGPN